MAEFDGEPQPGAMSGGKDADIVTEARSRYQLCVEAEDREEAMDDLRFLKGEQWDADAVRQRDLDSRPCLTFNNIPAILHQVTNDVRQNKQSIQVAPVDSGADVKVAEVIEGLIRHIEYDSGADAAYDTALDGAASIGFGFFRLVTEYESPESFNQVIKIRRIRNPFTVHVDPNAQEADGSDMQYAFLASRMPRDEFVRQYPKADTSQEGAGTAIGDQAEWAGKDWVRVAEYYRVEYEPAELVMLRNGQTMWADDPQYSAVMDAVAKRQSSRRKVMWYKLTGAEVLEKAEIACDWIPVFPVYGDEIDEDGKITRNGIIRNAKSPKQMENYWLTSATEEIAMRTKTPFIGALGQFEGLEQDWNQANVRNFSYLEYNPVTIDGNLAPAPQRQPPADVPAGFIQMAAMCRDNVKAVTGIYDASLGNRSNETSGLAIRARQAQGDIANFHFSDNLQRSMMRMAKCLIQMIPRIYDTERVVRILGEDRKQASFVAINKPETKPDEQGQAVQTVLNDLTVGTYDVTVSTGPAYNTLREEAAANMIELGGKWPKLMDVAGDKVIRALDWPGAEEIAERIEKTLPPGLVDNGDDQPNMVQTPKGPIPAQQAGQLIGQLDQTIEQMQTHMESLESGLAKTQLEIASRERIAALTVQGKHDDTELAGMVQLLLAGQRDMASRLQAFEGHAMAVDKMAVDASVDHVSAVAAAADPAHPAPPAPVAQGMEEAPATVSARDAEQAAPDAGDTASAPNEG